MNMFKPVGATNHEEYIAKLAEPRKSDIVELDRIIRRTVPKLKPYIEVGMLGYGRFHYKSKSGREGDWALIGLASQKNYISVYVCAIKGDKYLAEHYKEQLPKANIGKSCIRFKKLADIDTKVLAEIFKEAEKLGGFFQS